MSREVRRVPADWMHPVKASIERNRHRPDAFDYRARWQPLWAENMDDMLEGRQRTHWQMYETVSEGTPISPPCESPEALARWLVEHRASVFGSSTGTYDQWLQMITGSGATVGAAMHPDGTMEPGWLDGQGGIR